MSTKNQTREVNQLMRRNEALEAHMQSTISQKNDYINLIEEMQDAMRTILQDKRDFEQIC